MTQSGIKDWLVLLVDDTLDNLIVAEMALRFHGAEVISARSGAEALRLLDQLTPTVMLFDIRMPDMDGYTLFEIVRSKPRFAHVPIIAITAYAMQSDRESVLARGFDGYIPKPFDVTRLIDNIALILDQATSH